MLNVPSQPGYIAALPISGNQAGDLIKGLAPWLIAGGCVYCLDGGNAFNPAPLAVWLRTRRLDLSSVLGQRLFISRAFTCHQLLGAAEGLLGSVLKKRSKAIAIVLGLQSMFIDEDLPLFERQYFFKQTLDVLCGLANQGLHCLVSFADATPQPWAKQISRAMPVLPSLDQLRPTLESWNYGTYATHLQPIA